MSCSTSRRVIAGLLVMSGTWTACVGEDPGARTTGTHATGDRLGPCFPDGKCKQGLICRDGEICLAPDEPRPPGLDGGPRPPGDGGLDARPPFDGSVDAGALCAVPNAGPGPRCGPTLCGPTEACCAPNGGNGASCLQKNDPKCQTPSPTWGCDSPEHCGNISCCFVGENDVGPRCMSTMKDVTSRCLSPNECSAAGGMRGCSTTADCMNGTICTPTDMRTKLGFAVIVNVCR